MRTLLALLLLLAAGGCDEHVELPGATPAVEAPEAQPAEDAVQLAPTAAAPDVQTPTSLPLARILTGQVTAISDGDTLTVLDGTNTAHRIRLQGIDAPEGEQPSPPSPRRPSATSSWARRSASSGASGIATAARSGTRTSTAGTSTGR